MVRKLTGNQSSLCVRQRAAGLDCQRRNLRIATESQNRINSGKQKRNSSGFKGVRFHSQRARWNAQIGHNNRKLHIGYFDTPEQAAHAYDSKAVELFGEFAYLNFPRERTA